MLILSCKVYSAASLCSNRIQKLKNQHYSANNRIKHSVIKFITKTWINYLNIIIFLGGKGLFIKEFYLNCFYHRKNYFLKKNGVI